MPTAETIWAEIIQILNRREAIGKRRNEIHSLQPLDPNKPMPVPPQEYWDLLEKDVALTDQLDVLLEQFRKLP
jgi:DNA-binding SARP family transcriptional activator